MSSWLAQSPPSGEVGGALGGRGAQFRKLMKQRNFTLTILIFVFSLLGIINLSAQSCFDTGTLLFREDFKGNNPSDPTVALSDVSGGYSAFPFSSTPGQGYYSLVKSVSNPPAYWDNDDHTYPNDTNRGYFMFVDPSAGQMDAILYQKQINNLCDGVEVLFSVWASDLCKGVYLPPSFQLQITDLSNNVLAQTGVLVPPRAGSQAQWKWERFTLSVSIPSGVNSIKFTAINKDNRTSGNDLVLDDIEIFLCTGPVNVTANTADGQTIDFTGNHTNTIFTDTNLHSYWLHSTTGDMSSLSDWTPLDHKTGTCPIGSVWNHDFTLTNAQPGYYRLVVGNSNVLTSLCRAASPVLQPSPFEIVDIETDPVLPACRGKEITFEAKLNTTDMSNIESIKWDFGDGTVDEDTNPATFKIKKHIYAKSGNYPVTVTLKPKQQGGEVYLNSIKTIDIRIASCALPVNHNISVMGY